MKNNLPLKLRNAIFIRDNFSCQKCNFKDETSKDLELHCIKLKVFGGLNEFKNLITLFFIYHNYAPDSEKNFILYIIGRVKFASQESNGKHKSLISATLFNKIQNKLKQKGWIN